MKIKEVIKLVKNSHLRNLNLKTDDVIISYIYLGLLELHKRLNLSIRSEVVHVYPDLSVYEIRDDSIDMILGVYDTNNCLIKESDVIDSDLSKFKLLNYKSFIYSTDIEEDLICIYRYAPSIIINGEDDLDLPLVMIPILLLYIAYLGYSTISSDAYSQKESMNLLQIYESGINRLINEGHKINIFNESLYGNVKGFI